MARRICLFEDDTSAIRRWIVDAEDIKLWSQSEERFRHDLDQLRRDGVDCSVRRRGSAPATLEIVRDHVTHTVRAAGIAQHNLHHQLRSVGASSAIGMAAGLP
jgi:hypothetical protein